MGHKPRDWKYCVAMNYSLELSKVRTTPGFCAATTAWPDGRGVQGKSSERFWATGPSRLGRVDDARFAKATSAINRGRRMVSADYSDSTVSMLDLVQSGNYGLLRAADKFDPERGYRFSTYATWWILQEIRLAVAVAPHAVHVPVGNVDARRARRRVLSLARPLDDDGDELGDRIEDRDCASPADEAHLALRREQVEAALRTIPAREAAVLRMRFGIGGGHAWSLEEVARVLRISRERVRQLQLRALERLRSPARRLAG